MNRITPAVNFYVSYRDCSTLVPFGSVPNNSQLLFNEKDLATLPVSFSNLIIVFAVFFKVSPALNQ